MGKLHLILIILFGLIACSDSAKKSNSKVNDEEGVQVRIIKQMGQMPSDSIRYLPLIGSLAESKVEGDTAQYLILGKNIENGNNFQVKALSTLVYSHNNEMHKVIISVPLDEQYRSLNVNSFEQLATSYGSVKWALESWYNHFGGLGNSRFIKWENLSHN